MTPISRRQFLGTMGAGFGAATLLPSLAVLPAVMPLPPLDLHALTQTSPVLFVFRTQAIRKDICELMGYCGLKMIGTESPLEALRWMDERPYSLVMTEYYLPQMRGTELLRQIRGTPAIMHTPFGFLTAYDRPDHELQGLSYDFYLTMPFEVIPMLKDVIAALHRHYDRGQTSLDALVNLHLDWRLPPDSI
jgi:two-component system, chemotaxis family, chemotaxis protein CheY